MMGREGRTGGLLERSTLPFDAGTAFVLAAGGLRRMRGDGETLAGHAAEELFWRDVLELVHEEDRSRLGSVLSEVAGSQTTAPASLGTRLRDVSGDWTPAEVTIQRVIEAPGDTGLIVANVQAHSRAL